MKGSAIGYFRYSGGIPSQLGADMANEFHRKGLTQGAWIAETCSFQRKGSVQFWPLAGSWEGAQTLEMSIFVLLLAVTRNVYPNTVSDRGLLSPPIKILDT